MTNVRPILDGVCTLIYENMSAIQQHRFEITWKPDGSPVTEADLLVERLVEAYLREQLGDIRFIGEESYTTHDGDLSGWTAVLDPIDGTENFCSGLKEWGVSLTLWHDANHAGSLLLMPELHEQMITGDSLTPHRSRITGFSSSLTPELVADLAATGEGRVIGCAVYNLFNVVRGSYRRFVNPVGAYSWDLLAGAMLALEHGCDVTLDGKPFDGTFLEPGRRYQIDIGRHGDDHLHQR